MIPSMKKAIRRHLITLVALCVVLFSYIQIADPRPRGAEFLVGVLVLLAAFVGGPTVAVVGVYLAVRRRAERGAGLLFILALATPFCIYGTMVAGRRVAIYNTPHDPQSFFTADRRDALSSIATRLLEGDVEDLAVGRAGQPPIGDPATLAELKRLGFSDAHVVADAGIVEFRGDTRFYSRYYIYVSQQASPPTREVGEMLEPQWYFRSYSVGP